MKFPFLLFLFFLGTTQIAHASHIIGGEIGYTNIAGNQYEVTLTLYGDCSGNSFPNLATSVPTIDVYNGNSLFTSISLSPFGNFGVEVTPVCASQADNTSCHGGSLPGIAQFIFKNTVTLSGPSNWRFLFAGDMGGPNGGGAGRSNAITNIINGTGNNTSLMSLEAALDNTIGPNNSAIYSSIPTPFFCINIAQQYNQGAYDTDGDQLSFDLIPALDGSTFNGLIAYQPPFTFSQPLATTSGSFLFSPTTGQMSFVPNAVQNSLVVNRVTELRNGVVVGTSMREMTVVVLNNCNNQSPLGSIVSTSIGSINNANQITVCNSASSVNFTIQGSDPDTQAVNVLVNGLPPNASYVVNGNNTFNPTITVTWNFTQPVIPGSYTFYITFQDDGCPLTSKQTLAYTIVVEQPITNTLDIVNESCIPMHDGEITVNGSSTNGGVVYSFNGGAFQNGNNYIGLDAGIYTITIKDTKGCTLSLPVTVEPSAVPIIDNMNVQDIRCFGEQNGSIQATVTPANNYTYTLFPAGTSNTSGLFTGLLQNVYTLIVHDDKGCADTSIASVHEPDLLTISTVEITNVHCNKNNGRVLVKSNSTDSLTFLLRPRIQINHYGIFDGLTAGTYTVSIRNANDCQLDTIVTVGADPMNFFLTTSHHDLACTGWGYEGSAEVFTQGGVSPFTYMWNTSPVQTRSKITDLYYGWYIVTVTDATGCTLKDTVQILPGNCCEEIFIPSAFTPNGDGVNDEWKLISSTGMAIKEFAVYNRWGQRVWNTSDQRNSWKGLYQNRDAEAETYYYILRYTCLTDQKDYSRRGDVMLIR